jgi:hypothetical protein
MGLEVPDGDLENGPESAGLTFVQEKHRHLLIFNQTNNLCRQYALDY